MLESKWPRFPMISFCKDFDNLNIETIKHIKKIATQQIARDQTCIKDSHDYYIARDISSNTIYMCFKNMMMIDIDFNNNIDRDCVLKNLNSFCKNHSDYLFNVFTSRNGLHVFCISHKMDYTNLEHIQLMLDLQCDFFYTVYAHIRGWCVRLNRKMNEYDDYIRNPKSPKITALDAFESTVGNGVPDSRLLELINIYMSNVHKYNGAAPSKMP